MPSTSGPLNDQLRILKPRIPTQILEFSIIYVCLCIEILESICAAHSNQYTDTLNSNNNSPMHFNIKTTTINHTNTGII